MEKMVEVVALKPHRNDFGKKREKAQGDKYMVPERAVAALVGGGWISDPAGVKAKA